MFKITQEMQEKVSKLHDVVFEGYTTLDKPGYIGVDGNKLFVYIINDNLMKKIQTMKLPDLGVPIEIKKIGKIQAL